MICTSSLLLIFQVSVCFSFSLISKSEKLHQTQGIHPHEFSDADYSYEEMMEVEDGLAPLGLVEIQPLNFKQRLRLKFTPDVYCPRNQEEEIKKQSMVRKVMFVNDSNDPPI